MTAPAKAHNKGKEHSASHALWSYHTLNGLNTFDGLVTNTNGLTTNLIHSLITHTNGFTTHLVVLSNTLMALPHI